MHCVKGFIWTLLCSICERFRLERHRLIDALAALNVSIGIPIRDLCALKKWCAVKCLKIDILTLITESEKTNA
jgi:hypothetical protein